MENSCSSRPAARLRATLLPPRVPAAGAGETPNCAVLSWAASEIFGINISFCILKCKQIKGWALDLGLPPLSGANPLGPCHHINKPQPACPPASACPLGWGSASLVGMPGTRQPHGLSFLPALLATSATHTGMAWGRTWLSSKAAQPVLLSECSLQVLAGECGGPGCCGQVTSARCWGSSLSSQHSLQVKSYNYCIPED